MARFIGRFGLPCILFACLFGGNGVSMAGQSRNRPQPTEEQEAMEKMTIEELRAYQGYFYASGGRDPMTMRLPTSEELGMESKGSGTKKALTIEEMETRLDKAIADITAAIKILDYDEAIKASDEIIHEIDNNWLPLRADPPHIPRMNEEIRSYNRMAVRLKKQKDTADEFEVMQLKVNGVIWSPTDAKTVVNGRLLAAGEIMLGERKQGDLRIEVIEERGVVFQFKGMRFRIPVEIYAPLTHASESQKR